MKFDFDSIEIHPEADAYGTLSEERFTSLVESIKQYGQQQPIIMKDGKLAEGRHRLKACKILGIEPKFVDYTGPMTVAELVWVHNSEGRTKLGTQNAMAYALLFPEAKRGGDRKSEKAKVNQRRSTSLKIDTEQLSQCRFIIAEFTADSEQVRIIKDRGALSQMYQQAVKHKEQREAQAAYLAALQQQLTDLDSDDGDTALDIILPKVEIDAALAAQIAALEKQVTEKKEQRRLARQKELAAAAVVRAEQEAEQTLQSLLAQLQQFEEEFGNDEVVVVIEPNLEITRQDIEDTVPTPRKGSNTNRRAMIEFIGHLTFVIRKARELKDKFPDAEDEELQTIRGWLTSVKSGLSQVIAACHEVGHMGESLVSQVIQDGQIRRIK